jgi:hypothetical protein
MPYAALPAAPPRRSTTSAGVLRELSPQTVVAAAIRFPSSGVASWHTIWLATLSFYECLQIKKVPAPLACYWLGQYEVLRASQPPAVSED